MKEKEQKAVRIQLIMVQGKNALGIIARPLSLFTPLLRLTQHRLLLTPPPPSALDSKVERERDCERVERENVMKVRALVLMCDKYHCDTQTLCVFF